MAEFLSDRWITELDQAARRAADLVSEEPLTVEQVVRSADGTDVRYQVNFGPDGASVSGNGGARADVALITDSDTAWALHQGVRRAQDAFARGDLKVRGRAELLATRADLFARLERAWEPVRARTTVADDR